MACRPHNMAHGVEEPRGSWLTFVLGLQHLCVVAIAFVMPMLVVREIGGSVRQAEFVVDMTMLAFRWTRPQGRRPIWAPRGVTEFCR